MKLTKITLCTVAHFLVACSLWFLTLTVSLGLGFKSDWTIWDHIYSFAVVNGTKALSFPLWYLVGLDLPGWVKNFYIPGQLLISFVQVSLALYLLSKIRNKFVERTI